MLGILTVTVGILNVTVGILNATVGILNEIIGLLKATIGSLNEIIVRIASEDVNERLRFFYIVEAEAERSSALFCV